MKKTEKCDLCGGSFKEYKTVKEDGRNVHYFQCDGETPHFLVDSGHIDPADFFPPYGIWC